MTWARRLNPRLHFAAAIGWAVFAVVTLVALVTANMAAALAEQQARDDAEGQLAELATQVRDAVSMNVETRRSLLQATAAQISASGDRSASAALRTLAAVRIQFPEMRWLGVMDGQGRVMVGTTGVAVGTDLSAAGWFGEGQGRAFAGDRHASVLEGQAPGPALMVAAPLDLGAGPGVLAAELTWGWIEGVVARMQSALSRQRGIELMLADRDGQVLAGPAGWPGGSRRRW